MDISAYKKLCQLTEVSDPTLRIGTRFDDVRDRGVDDGPSIHSKKPHFPLFAHVQNLLPLFAPSLTTVRSEAGILHRHCGPADDDNEFICKG